MNYEDDDYEDIDEVFDLYDMTEDLQDDTDYHSARLSGEGELNRALKVFFPSTVMPKNWQRDALCGKETIEVEDRDERRRLADRWFAPTRSTTAAEAADKCFTCPVRQQCLEWSTQAKPAFGIWGGQTLEVRTGITKIDGKLTPVHDYEYMKDLPNPYDTEDPRSKTYRPKLWNQVKKACTQCLEVKYPEDYRPNGLMIDGLSVRCLDCIYTTE